MKQHAENQMFTQPMNGGLVQEPRETAVSIYEISCRKVTAAWERATQHSTSGKLWHVGCTKARSPRSQSDPGPAT